MIAYLWSILGVRLRPPNALLPYPLGVRSDTKLLCPRYLSSAPAPKMDKSINPICRTNSLRVIRCFRKSCISLFTTFVSLMLYRYMVP